MLKKISLNLRLLAFKKLNLSRLKNFILGFKISKLNVLKSLNLKHLKGLKTLNLKNFYE